MQGHYNAVNFLKNIHKRHPVSRPLGRGMGCLLWIQHLIDIFAESLHSFMQYLTILDHIMTALDYTMMVWTQRNLSVWECKTLNYLSFMPDSQHACNVQKFLRNTGICYWILNWQNAWIFQIVVMIKRFETCFLFKTHLVFIPTQFYLLKYSKYEIYLD